MKRGEYEQGRLDFGKPLLRSITAVRLAHVASYVEALNQARATVDHFSRVLAYGGGINFRFDT